MDYEENTPLLLSTETKGNQKESYATTLNQRGSLDRDQRHGIDDNDDNDDNQDDKPLLSNDTYTDQFYLTHERHQKNLTSNVIPTISSRVVPKKVTGQQQQQQKRNTLSSRGNSSPSVLRQYNETTNVNRRLENPFSRSSQIQYQITSTGVGHERQIDTSLYPTEINQFNGFTTSIFIHHGCCCCQCIRTNELGFYERWGEFYEIAHPGYHCLCWPMDKIAGKVSLRIQQLDIDCETITFDKVFIHLSVSILYRVTNGMSYEAYYKLTNTKDQIISSVLDVIRSVIPKHSMDDVFLMNDLLSTKIRTQLDDILIEWGYEITNVLVTKIQPNSVVVTSMNAIGTARRMKEAAIHLGEGKKIQRIKEAESYAERSYLLGVGTANERTAIVNGLKETITFWSEIDVRSVTPPTPKEIMDTLLLTQYMDLLHSLHPETIILHHNNIEKVVQI